MLETNLRIVDGGTEIRLPVRHAKVQAAHLTSTQMEQACGRLAQRCEVAAKPTNVLGELIALSQEPLPTIKLEDPNQTFTIQDSGKDGCGLTLSDYSGKWLVPALLERAIIGEISRSTNLWRLDSWRKWYQPTAFLSEDGFKVFRRFEISGMLVEDVGVGIAVDVSTAFFTQQTLGYFFALNVGPQERRQREELFTRLTMRQKGQKGTLVYNRGDFKGVCYFEKADADRTCGRTPEIRISGRTYKTLYHYYSERNPQLQISPNDPAVLVSFRGTNGSVWVAARLLRIRVMNDALPESLSSVDKIAPLDRVRMIEEFWSLFSHSPFGKLPLRLSAGFWQPARSRVIRVQVPALEFGKGQVMSPPTGSEPEDYRDHFRQRLGFMEKAGVYHLPPSTERTIHFAHPKNVNMEIANQFARDVTELISKWTSIQFNRNVLAYDNITDATSRLRALGSAGTVVFVLDEEPAAYYETSFQLPGWRLKRVTSATLTKHFKYFQEGAWDRRTKQKDLRRGRRKWDQYVVMNTCDVMQQMDCVPYRVASLGEFEAAVAIDVGHDRRYVAISLMIARNGSAIPSFRLLTDVHPKTDPQFDAINPTILADMIVQLLAKALRGRYTPLRSLLVVRDGQFSSGEETGINQAVARLKQSGALDQNCSTVMAELHKSTQKNIRIWERHSDDDITNVLEGSAVIISSDTAVLATTGEATLHQGTAEPLMLVCGESADMLRKVTEATAIGAQLNWASPGVAQRLPLFFKRTDEELEIRAAQEVRRIA